MGHYFRFAVLTVGIFHASSVLAATFKVEQWYGRRYHIMLDGVINMGDDKIFQQTVLEQIREGHILSALGLNTPGGNVPAAISIGEQLRVLKLSTVAPFLDQNGAPACRYGSFDNFTLVTGDSACMCASACFIVWSGGWDREGQYIGIHHPYYNAKTFAETPVIQADEEYSEMTKEVVKYFAKMQIPNSIVRKMFKYMSDDMHYLTPDELEDAKNTIGTAGIDQYIHDKCGKLPPGNIYSDPYGPRKKWIDCQSVILEAYYATGEQAYLDLYGNPGEKVPDTTIVKAPPPPPTPAIPVPSSPSVVTRPWPETTTPNQPVVVPPAPSGRTVHFDGPNASYWIRNNRDLDGDDLKPYHPNVDQNTCAELCSTTFSCQGFSFDDWNHFCILKTNIRESRLEPREISGVTREFFTEFPAPVSDLPHFEHYANAYFVGDGYAVYSTPDHDSCERTCGPDLRCVAYSYNDKEHTCHLFNSTGLYYHDRSRTMEVSVGVKTQSIEH